MPGIWELLIVLAIVLLIFGAKRLPSLGEALGKSIRGFRGATQECESSEEGRRPDARELRGP